MRRVIFITGGTGYVGRHLIPALLARGHDVRALVRAGSEPKLAPGCTAVTGNALDRATFEAAIAPADTFIQLVGVSHPSPAKAKEFREIDLRSGLESIAAASAAGVRHFVYVSVAQPAPVMHAYQTVRHEVEVALTASALVHTVLRPWYVLGPGHYWPYALVPAYWLLGLLPATRESAMRLGLVNIKHMVAALVEAVEDPPLSARLMAVPDIKRAGIGEAG